MNPHNDADWRDNWLQIPHECSDPDCPGHVNRRKLAAFDGLLEALTDLTQATSDFHAKQAAGFKDLDDEYCWLFRSERKAREVIAKAPE